MFGLFPSAEVAHDYVGGGFVRVYGCFRVLRLSSRPNASSNFLDGRETSNLEDQWVCPPEREGLRRSLYPPASVVSYICTYTFLYTYF